MATSAKVLSDPVTQFVSDVRAGLCRPGQKELPSKYLYDALGFALFEAISLLPEYGLTRADERLLRRHAKEIVRHVPGPTLVSELGSGSGRKTRWILSALCEREPVSYYPIEISRAALASCESELGDVECVSIVGVEREYLDGLREVAALRADGMRLLVLFLGSTIGNFDAGADARFLSEVRSVLAARRFASARDRSREADRADAGSLRRSARGDGGVQQEPAWADESGTGRRLRSSPVRARSPFQPGNLQYRDASAVEERGRW